MVLVLIILFLKNIWILLNKFYTKIHPKKVEKVIKTTKNNQCQKYRSTLSSTSSSCSSGIHAEQVQIQQREGRGKKSTALRRRQELK